MSEWGIALIAAGSAVAGSIVTGWFTRSAGHRQAAAARHAGDRQADALIATVQATLNEQQRSRALDLRRQIYTQFLEAALLPRRSREERVVSYARLEATLAAIELEGPEVVKDAARNYQTALTGQQTRMNHPDFMTALLEVDTARIFFTLVARQALDENRVSSPTPADPDPTG